MNATLFAEVMASGERRAQFASAVQALLAPHGVDLASSELGRRGREAVWILCLRLPRDTYLTVHVPLHATRPAFGEETERAVADRVIAYLHSRGLGV